MNRRILDVTAATTLDHADAAARGHDWRDEGPAVLDVRTPREEPDRVVLDLEVDAGALEHVDQHADSVSLSTEQARTVADALVAAIDDGSGCGRRG